MTEISPEVECNPVLSDRERAAVDLALPACSRTGKAALDAHRIAFS